MTELSTECDWTYAQCSVLHAAAVSSLVGALWELLIYNFLYFRNVCHLFSDSPSFGVTFNAVASHKK